MRRVSFVCLLGLLPLFAGCEGAAHEGAGLPPRARVAPHRLELHGHVRLDDYYWLNRRDDPEVAAYLEAENAYTSASMAHTEALQKKLFEEMKGRIKQDDSSVPYKLDDHYYYTRFEEGGEYEIRCRKHGSLDAAEEVLLDVNTLAAGHDFFQVRGIQVSAGRNLLAFAVDTVGRRIYTLHFKDLTTGEMLGDEIPEVTGELAWAGDDRTVFYAKHDPATLRSHRIYRHVLGTDVAADELIFEERDDTFSASVWKTKSEKYVMIGSFHTLSSEIRFLDAANPTGRFEVFLPRERDHEYMIDHFQDHFFVSTNDQARNFRLMKTPVDRTARESWEEVIPHRDDVLLEDIEIFRDFLVVAERRDGLIELRIRPWSGEAEHYLDFGEPAYMASLDQNPEFDTSVLRYTYTSMTTPKSVFDYDMTTRERQLRKRDEVLLGFDSANYRTERRRAAVRDGTNVPISLVYRVGTRLDGTSPLLLYGYGSYGLSLDAEFRADRLSLIDRGFVFAIAHVRGGQELGRRWYEDGKLLRKMNTFTDFIDCAEFLVREKYADPHRLFASGGSAGGLLMGAVTNMRPDLFRGVVAKVPFVDVITTMLDESIPLTTGEYDEWGDPRVEESYRYMLAYSPYDNVEAKAYPNLLVTTGLHDSQVQYWEPAKWVAKMRARKTDSNRLLLHTEMGAGHGGVSGRFRRYEETALVWAFLLDLAGIQS